MTMRTAAGVPGKESVSRPERSKWRRWRAVVQSLLGVAIFLAILSWFGIRDVFSMIASCRYPWLFLYAPLYFLGMVCGALGLRALFNEGDRKLAGSGFLPSYLFAQNLGVFLPFQAGEASIILLLKEKQIPATHSAVVFGIDKVVSATVTVIAGLIGYYVLFGRGPASHSDAWLGVLAVYLTLGSLIAVSLLFSSMSARLEQRAAQSASRWGRSTSKILRCFQVRGVTVDLATSLFRVCLFQPLIAYTLFRAIPTGIPFAHILLANAVLNVALLIPLTPLSLGILEAGAAVVYTSLGVPGPQVIAVYLLSRISSALLSGAYIAVHVSRYGYTSAASPLRSKDSSRGV